MRYMPVALGLLSLALLACGGGGGTGPTTQADGVLYVQNVNTGLRIWVTVISIGGQPPEEKDLPQGVSPQQEVEIPLNDITPVTAVLTGGVEVLLKLRVSRERMKEFDLPITIDGSRLLYITDMNPYEEGLPGLKHQLRPYG